MVSPLRLDKIEEDNQDMFDTANKHMQSSILSNLNPLPSIHRESPKIKSGRKSGRMPIPRHPSQHVPTINMNSRNLSIDVH